MLTLALDPFNQLATQRQAVPIPVPAPRHLPAGRGFLGEQQPGLPAGYERAPSFITGHKVLLPRPGATLSTELAFSIEPAAELLSELRGTPSTLCEASTVPLSHVAEPKLAPQDVLPFLMAVRRFIETDQLTAARQTLDAAPAYILRDPLVMRLRSILAPPLPKRVYRRDVDRTQEYGWLRTESFRYRGRWVALKGNQLLASAPSLRELLEQLRSMTLTRPPLVHRVD